MKELNNKLAQVQTKLKAKKSSYNSFGKYYFRKSEDIIFKNKNYQKLYYTHNIYNTYNYNPSMNYILEKDISKISVGVSSKVCRNNFGAPKNR